MDGVTIHACRSAQKSSQYARGCEEKYRADPSGLCEWSEHVVVSTGGNDGIRPYHKRVTCSVVPGEGATVTGWHHVVEEVGRDPLVADMGTKNNIVSTYFGPPSLEKMLSR